jgi:prepilin-type N-terminal cleavage/methylation domain-containing protein
MEFKLTKNHNRGSRGFTLVEMMVGVAIGCLLLAAVATLYVFSMRSFGAMANYSDMNERSRYASDLISRDIRCCTKVDDATTPTKLVLVGPDTVSKTTYMYDPDKLTLNRIQGTDTKILLSGVDSVNFALYERPDVGAYYEVIPQTSVAAYAKLVSFQWSCSRKLVGSVNNSESLEAAMVEIRNK